MENHTKPYLIPEARSNNHNISYVMVSVLKRIFVSRSAFHILQNMFESDGKFDPICYIDRRLSINAAFYDALKQLRTRVSTRRLWVDQVCIKKEYLGERSRQVQVRTFQSPIFHIQGSSPSYET